MYRWLLDSYYYQESPITTDIRVLMRKMGLTSDQKDTLQTLLDEFFTLEEDGYHQNYADRALARVYAKSVKAKASANARWSQRNKNANASKKDANAMRTHSERNANGMLQKEKEKEKGKVKSIGKRFAPPNAEEVQAYIVERKIEGFNGETFCDFYIARNWQLSHGKQMADWKAAVRTWDNRRKSDSVTEEYGKGAI